MASPYPPYPPSASELRRPPISQRRRNGATVGALATVLMVAAITWPRQSVGSPILGPAWSWICVALWLGAAVAVAVWVWWGGERKAVVAAAVLLTVLLGGYSQAARYPRMMMGDPQAWFGKHRADFAEAARLESRQCCAGYYGELLPRSLRYLTVDGRVSGSQRALFFPQWTGIPDDAGGYWYSPDEKPEDYDMYGMLCSDPVDLGDGWWMCGM